MKKSLIAAVLIIAVIGAALYGASQMLAETAQRNADAERFAMMKTLLPGSESFEAEEYSEEEHPAIDWVYKGENGYVMQTSTTGYAGDVVLMVGVHETGEVTGLVVREMKETIGIGANVLTEEAFLNQFLNTTGEAQVGETVDALTGATVTSKAVAKGVNSAIAYVTGADVVSSATTWGG